MQRFYPVVIDQEGAVFGATAPDFPGCVSSGASPEEALAGIAEALAGHVTLMAADGDPIPEPSAVTAIPADPECEEVCRALVPVSVPGRIQRYNVSLPEDLVAEIDAMVGKGHRSRFLASAARAALRADQAADMR